MSDYSKITRHPQSGQYELAQWHDDYFGPHLYGVKFHSDNKVYPADLVERKEIYDFWKEDVLKAYEVCEGPLGEQNIIDFLNEIERQYKARWERDSALGEGAVEHSRILPRNNAVYGALAGPLSDLSTQIPEPHTTRLP